MINKNVVTERYNVVTGIDTQELEKMRRFLGILNLHLLTGMSQSTYHRITDKGSAREDTMNRIIEEYNKKIRAVKKLKELTIDDFLLKNNKKKDKENKDHYYDVI